MTKIAYFVSSHGYGHAGRATAIMLALQKIIPGIDFHIFTLAPDEFYASCEIKKYKTYQYQTDVGFVQKDALTVDINKTKVALDEFEDYKRKNYQKIIGDLMSSEADLLISDISPWGIELGSAIGMKTILVENFTWDWIYKPYPELRKYAEYNNTTNMGATYRIQSNPLCSKPISSLITNPIGREPHKSKNKMRDHLNLSPESRVVLITLGGIDFDYSFVEKIGNSKKYSFIVVGNYSRETRDENLIKIPYNTYYQPDLVALADVIICKAGYSTFAEAYVTKTALIYTVNNNSPESRVLADWFKGKDWPGFEISKAEMIGLKWIDQLDQIDYTKFSGINSVNGANRAANIIKNYGGTYVSGTEKEANEIV